MNAKHTSLMNPNEFNFTIATSNWSGKKIPESHAALHKIIQAQN